MRFDRLRRREFITLIGGAAAWPLAASAQQPAVPMPSVGWLVTGAPASYRFSLAAFRDGLKALNYTEGQNIRIEYRWAEGNVARLPELANELVQQKVNVIIAGGALGAEAAKHATSVIPIIAVGVGDLAELGLVDSLAHPGGNLTGFVAKLPETAGKRLEMMREILPKAKRAAVLWNPTSSDTKLELDITKDIAARNDIALGIYGAENIQQLKDELVRFPQFNPDMLVVLTDPFLFTQRKLIVHAAEQARLPAIYAYREYVDDGGLISYGASITDTYRRAAGYVDKILRGAKPADLPVQLPIKIELVVNLKAAKAIGFALPESFLLRADDTLE
jgi:putative ABC transport system substrate-binding protein